MKRVLIEFSWRGERISQFVDKNSIFEDIANSQNLTRQDIWQDDFWGEFVIGNDRYQYQIWWNSGEIVIFHYGATDYCAIVSNFTLDFSQIY